MDRGNSDFDQRHNLVLYSTWQLPEVGSRWVRALTQDWQFAQLAAFRSGFPFTVFGRDSEPSPSDIDCPQLCGRILGNRPGLVLPGDTELRPLISKPGGLQILNSNAFNPNPGAGVVGDLGRNSLMGPGFWNVDFSLSRSVVASWLGEAGRVQLRADFFNVFNHANLGDPISRLTSDDFGVALYGRQGRESGFPASVPLNETPRQVQLQVKLYF